MNVRTWCRTFIITQSLLFVLVAACDSTDNAPAHSDAGDSSGDAVEIPSDTAEIDTDLVQFVPESGPMSACSSPSYGAETLPTEAFASPYGVVVVDDLVVITNANLDENYTPGVAWLSIVDADTLELKNRIVLPYANPQYLTYDDDVLYASMSGPSVYDLDSGLFYGTGSGGVAMIHKNNLLTASRVGGEVKFSGFPPKSLAGFPGSLVSIPEMESLFVGSGTGPYVYVIDTVTCQFKTDIHSPWLAGPEDGLNHLVYVGRSTNNELLVTDFNSGTLQWWDPSTGVSKMDEVFTRASEDDVFPGPSLPVAYGNDVVLLNAVSQTVVRVSKTEGTTWIADVGAYPNRISVVSDIAYVTISPAFDSGKAGYLTRINLQTGDVVEEFATFDVGTNPMAVAWHSSTNRLFVTGNGTDSIIVLDADTGAIEKLIRP